jgi:methionine salvage enolase-phosphatase E1
MKIKRNKNKILLQDFESPDIEIATLDDTLLPKHKDHFVNEHNSGVALLEIYEKHRGNMHIENVLEMLKEIEKEYREYDEKRYLIKRG